MRRFDRISVLRRSSAAIAAGLALMLLAAEPASAATEIEGSLNDVDLRVRNAPIRDVLAALAARFKLTYRVPPNLTGELSGRYSGPLNQVLVRILDGVDYVVEASGEGISLVILNPADKAKASQSGAPDNNRPGVSAAGLPANPARQGQANSLQAGAPQAGAIQASKSQPVSSPTARQPSVIPGNAASATVPPLASFLPTSSPEPLP
jgi:hypothetical protein